MKFNSKLLIAPILAASLALAPVNQANAYWRGGHDHWGGGRGFGIGAAVGGLLTGAVLLATLPVRAVGEAVAAPAPGYGYAPPPAQVAYAQPAYAPEPVYTNAYVAAPPAYYYAPPRYYAPRYYYGY